MKMKLNELKMKMACVGLQEREVKLKSEVRLSFPSICCKNEVALMKTDRCQKSP